MRYILVLLFTALLLPLTAGLEASTLFFPGEHPEGYTVSCEGKKYDVFVVRSGGMISAAAVLRDGNAVEDFEEYNKVLQTLWYYLQIASFADAITFYSPDTATSLQSLANSLQNEEYDLTLAAERLRDLNFPEYAEEVEQLNIERAHALQVVRNLALDLSRSSRDLLKFLKTPFCGFALDVNMYTRFEDVYRLLNGYDKHARYLMSALAQIDSVDAETASALSLIIKYLSPPFSMAEIDSLRARVATEKELVQQVQPLEGTRQLLEDFKKRVQRAEYLSFISTRVSNVGNLEQTVQYLLTIWPESEERAELELAYQQMKTFEREGDYTKALQKARAVKSLAIRMIKEGVPEGEAPWPLYLAGVVILLVVVYILMRVRRRGKSEPEDVYSGYY